MRTFLCDVHTHTLFSRHAYSTLEENVRVAAEKGLQLLGSTDHFGSMLSAGCDPVGTSDLRDFQFFVNQDIWPRSWHGVTLVRGIEADVIDGDGHLFGQGCPVSLKVSGGHYKYDRDLCERALLNLDYAIASVHNKEFTLDRTRSQNTAMYIAALEHPKVLILGHIGRSAVDFEFDPVIEAARDLGKLIEINEFSLTGRADVTGSRARTIAQRCAELGCGVSVGSDAHISPMVGSFPAVSALFDEIGFPDELVATRDAAAFLRALADAGIPGPGGGPAFGGAV